MKDSRKPPLPAASLDAELCRQLDDICAEDTPERLLDLARTLQDLLRQREKPN
ncbi:hypothetical protein [Brevirhabdus sp.]|uniref:hypothetical protein n=1 Tax=Brevirhabdus sp. TaxID=2004514 RepID=UPI0040599CFF